MTSLIPLVRGYLESAGFKILLQEHECLVADKLIFGQDRDTWIVWTVPASRSGTSYESALRASISALRPNYPDARAYVLAASRGGFSRDLLQTLSELRIKFLVPVQFFDTAFKVEEAPRTASVVSDVRNTDIASKRVPQPYRIEAVTGDSPDGPDLFQELRERLVKPDGPSVRIVVGRAGIGKSFLFHALFTRLYEEFLDAKARLEPRSRPIPFVPAHLKDTYAIRTELLVEKFLRSDVASPVARETFEWLLVNGFSIWLLDGLDELYAGDPYFFDYLADLITRKDSKAQITIWCRDSLLTTSDAFAEFRDLCGETSVLQVYHLKEWERPSKRNFAWLGLEGRFPRSGDSDTAQVTSFLGGLDRSPTLRALSGIPFYCHVLLQQFRNGSLQEFSDDVALLNYVIDEMIKREVDKGLLDLRFFAPGGLQDWLEEIAVTYAEDGRYADIDHKEAVEYGRLVLREGVDETTEKHILTSLLQFPLFRAGSESGLIGFTHDLIAQALAARAYLRLLRRQPADVARRLARIDLEDPTLLRFMAGRLNQEDADAIAEVLRREVLQDHGLATLLTLLMLARPEHDLVKRLRRDFDAQNLADVRFRKRDLSRVSFRRADLSRVVFEDCDLRGSQFEGAFLSRTRFEGDTQLEGADFGDLSRVQSLWAGKRFIEDPVQVREWAAKATGRPEAPGEPCPTALQLLHVFGKFITPLGDARRDDLKRDALVAGRRYAGAASTEECVDEATRNGYLSGADYRDRFRRAEGDRYAEMVRFVRDGSVSEGLGRVVASLCRRRGCVHQLRP